MAPSRVVIAFARAGARAEADRQASASLAAGFARESIAVVELAELEELVTRTAPDDLVIVSAHHGGDARDGLAALAELRARLATTPAAAPEVARPAIIVLGDRERRAAALAAGASAFFARPAFVKDVVTLGRILSMPREGLAPGWGGELDGLHLYYMVRALTAARMTGVLALVREGRRGELRFFEGEVTSAQVGGLHGQAAFHQLLLWPDATYDLRSESVVRRQQIPLSPSELLVDAERFLRDFSELSGGLAPASVYDQELVQAAQNVERLPKEVLTILRLFDGARSVADVIEESPLRLVETLRVVGRLVDLGVVKRLDGPRPQHDAGAALLVEDWLVGQALPAAVPVGERPRRRKGETPAHGELAADWGSLGLVAAWDAPGYAPVVPSMTATGEISVGAAVAARPVAALPGKPEEEAEPRIAGKNGKPGRADGARAAKAEAAVTAAEAATGAGAGAEAATGAGAGAATVAGAEAATGAAAAAVAAAVAEAATAIGAVAATATVAVAAAATATATAGAAAAPATAAAAAPSGPGGMVGHGRHFEEHEEAFFNSDHAAHDEAHPVGVADHEDAKPRLGFWRRLFGKGAAAARPSTKRRPGSAPGR